MWLWNLSLGWYKNNQEGRRLKVVDDDDDDSSLSGNIFLFLMAGTLSLTYATNKSKKK
jgi:hypothetical protein